ncbi:unnamed protein product [Didymodactylos carnosus]|uniref:Uncharacterized protein n=1 Tax=Didymodactylos carnosus TaxID=1234261 RepID=A0A814HNA3_9BILA|nr:unnamed protein product [Didymodactylos carnosus]CAF1220521.1 unnamed protein product [Didymodactylos carnosus]CAF3783080.1 unnamed protein product [Didymodactylos carnosus]CAF4028539.1 unnamed protein product [Didymodactylos carnosus]
MSTNTDDLNLNMIRNRRDIALQALFESRQETRQAKIDQFQSDIRRLSLDELPSQDVLDEKERQSSASIDSLEKLDIRKDVVLDIETCLKDLNDQAQLLGIKRTATVIADEEGQQCGHNNKTAADGKNDSDKMLKQTTTAARLAVVLIMKGLMWAAIHLSQGGKMFTNLSSAIAYLRQNHKKLQVPNHLLLEWEKNIYLFDLFIADESIYCNHKKATDLYNICAETYDWINIYFTLYKDQPELLASSVK